ncbi:hypothetical protein Tco_0637933 [Tanacetum coccineum]
MARVDVDTLTMEQYLALSRENEAPGVVKPKIKGNVNFKIKSQFMRELREDTFSGNKDEGISNYTQGTSLEMERQASSRVNHIHGISVKKEIIWRYCHPFITAKKLYEIRNFKQERDATLYHAWERYNDLLYQWPLHDLNSQQKVHIFYTGLDISTCKILDSTGFIPLMTPTQALESIQVIADHSRDWYDETTTRERINDVMYKVDAIHESFKGEHVTKEYPLKKEDEAIKHSRYMEPLEETIIKF